jgi:hypothetical protein
LRGAVAIALAMSLPKHFPYRWQIIDFAFGVTLFMLLVNGTTMSWMIRRLGLNKPSPLLELLGAYAAARAARNAIERLRGHKPVLAVSDEQREQMIAPQERNLREAEDRLEELRARLSDNRIKRRKLLWLQAFAVQREIYLKRFENGLLSRRAQQALEWDLKNKRIGVDSERVVEDQRLPSDRKSGPGVLRLLQQVLPGIRPIAGWHKRRVFALAEEATAVVAAARAVRGEMPQLAEFSAADPDDVEHCAQYYEHLEEMARGRLDMLTESYEDSGMVITERMAGQLVLDAKLDAVDELARTGGLPEQLAEELREELEAEQAMEMKSL